MTSLMEQTRTWKSQPHIAARVVVFGSSNTELSWHNQGRFSWACWLGVSLREHIGRHVSLTNAGISGETVKDLHKRLDRDVLPINPALVVVTIGGNDRNSMQPEEYRQELMSLGRRILASGTQVVFQTYYSPIENKDITHFFTQFMDAKREVAAELDVPCIDSYPAMDNLRMEHPDEYAKLMLDSWHLNPIGHAVYGTLCVRGFGLPDPMMPEDIAPIVSKWLARL